tara:strand:- start:806 stop:1063 length:258 start_codon:yes stop_codon:yes gene_type:complete
MMNDVTPSSYKKIYQSDKGKITVRRVQNLCFVNICVTFDKEFDNVQKSFLTSDVQRSCSTNLRKNRKKKKQKQQQHTSAEAKQKQ